MIEARIKKGYHLPYFRKSEPPRDGTRILALYHNEYYVIRWDRYESYSGDELDPPEYSMGWICDTPDSTYVFENCVTEEPIDPEYWAYIELEEKG